MILANSNLIVVASRTVNFTYCFKDIQFIDSFTGTDRDLQPFPFTATEQIKTSFAKSDKWWGIITNEYSKFVSIDSKWGNGFEMLFYHDNKEMF